MNPNELDQLLRKIPVPQWDEQHWKDFPEAVTRRIKSGSNHGIPWQSTGLTEARRQWAWVWGGGLSTVAAMLLLFHLWKGTAPANEQLEQLRICFQQVAPLFPKQLEAVILTADGVQLQLSDRPVVPDSPALFLRVCPASNKTSGSCTTAVSFSGRKIQLAGREFEILVNGKGEIFLLAEDGVWVPGHALVGLEKWRFETGWLESL
jgi:hypothetical protein